MSGRRKPFVPQRHCEVTGKLCFPDHQSTLAALWKASDARKRAAQEPEHGVTRRGECRSYRCPHCKQWHLTSQKLH